MQKEYIEIKRLRSSDLGLFVWDLISQKLPKMVQKYINMNYLGAFCQNYLQMSNIFRNFAHVIYIVNRMNEENKIQLFEGQQVRYVWDSEKEKYFFSVVDVIQVLTDSPRPRKYWNALKTKLMVEGSEVSQNMGQLKLPAPDGKMRLTDVADTEQVFRLIQSIPSKKAEPLKLWLASVGQERLKQQTCY